MADVAMVFHWPPDVLMEMDLDEMLLWHGEARARAKLLFR
ncbi:MAG: GpE family phage tail protein [Acidobacteriota bacterium]